MTHHYTIARERLTVTTHLTLTGEFDIAARDDLRHALLTAVADGTHVIVDLDDVDFLDSESLSALVDGFNAARSAGLNFRLHGARGTVKRVLDITGVGDLANSG
jgi:anti-anti-sigma factor